MSVIVLPRKDSTDEAEVRETVWAYLEPRRLLTTQHHVVGPVWAPVSLEVLVARQPDVRNQDLEADVVKALEGFLSPYSGGSNGQGWPFGRNVYVSELYQVLEAVPGIDYVPDVLVSSRCLQQDPRCVPAEELWHEDGDQVGLGLADHHLPRCEVDPNSIVSSARFVRLAVTLELSLAEGTPPAAGRRAVRLAVRALFHPLYGGPSGSGHWQLGSDRVTRTVENLREVASVGRVELEGDAKHIGEDARGVVVVSLNEDELADVRVAVRLR